jgi:hypothetical protein
MAKGEGKKKDKKDTIKIPKRIAGVKISKAVRKAGKSALKLTETPAVSETVAAALLAAAAALRDPPAARRGARASADAAREAIGLGDSLRRLALDMARRTLDAWEAAESKPRGKAEHKVGNG